jgi:hypothetical protein
MSVPSRRIDWPLAAVLLGAAALGACARPYAASDNDSSRLATVEAIVDYHTLAIDQTVYVPPGSAEAPPDHRPFLVDEDGRDGNKHRDGTMDKLRIGGRFYSDKPMLPAFVLAGPYWVTQQLTGLRARERPDLFALLMTLLTSGVPYVVAVAAVARTGRLLGVAPRLNVALAASFAFATVAAAYTRHANSHATLLAVAALVFMLLAGFPRDRAAPPHETAAACAAGSLGCWGGKLLLLGLLNGFGYALEQPTGGLLLGGTGLVLLYRRPMVTTALVYGLAALPCVAGHQSIVYALAGSFAPLNQNPAYFDYPGSAFGPDNLTGHWNHAGVGAFLYYAGALVVGPRGFLSANVPLWLLVPGVVVLRRRVRAERAEVALALLWPLAVWLVYAALSTNYSGAACAVRWFVPFLAAGYYLLALLLRERPDLAPDFLLLSGWGAVLGLEMWWGGPWAYVFHSFWPVQILAPLSWAAYRLWRWRAARAAPTLAAT